MNKIVLNPYRKTSWENQYKANFHTHVNRWGTGHSELNPDEVIDLYHSAGYDILALTEHLTYVWPWLAYDRDPEELGMIAVKGVELHAYPQHDVLCLYGENVADPTNNDFELSMQYMREAEAIGIIAHPRASQYIPIYPFEWYVGVYSANPFMVGMEIFNPKYGSSEEWWDKILSVFMPFRPIWGFANDDMHFVTQTFNKNRNTILSDFMESAVKDAIISGSSYFCTGDIETDIKIKEIIVDEKSITIDTDDDVEIEWITFDGLIVATGACLSYRNNRQIKRYIRARLLGDTNNAYTQPFGILDVPDEEKISSFSAFPKAYPSLFPKAFPIE